MTPAGVQRSCGICVTYSYGSPQQIYSNNRAYLVDNTIAASPEVWGWLGGGQAGEL